ncbi:heterokaryon incompatibility protein-domain-containing protein [Hypomontagnella submonticulosa]|nr:heterokaryon incompatibility protein-domain-containing protein [Hypomontagnella submonticulosa]
MANRSPDELERSETIASLEKTQATLQETFATGRVPVEKEIEIRTQIADFLLRSFDQLQHQKFIYDAIQHVETALRRAPRTSPNYPKYLNSLSQARTSEYLMTGSRHALDLAVQAGRQAAELASSSDLRNRDFEAYVDIANTLGFALSRRHALSLNIEDLDEAIVYTRMVYDGAAKGSDRHFAGLNNLVSQLNRRIEQIHNDDLEREAEGLMNELATSTQLGTLQHGIAIGQLGIMTSKKFNRTGSLEDLDKAIEQCKTGLEALPQNHEVRIDMLSIIVNLYGSRRTRKKEAADLERLVYYSRLLLEASPVGHQSHGPRLLEHARRVKEYIADANSPEELEIAIGRIQKHLSSTPSPFPQKEECQVILSDLLGMRYTISTTIEDLIALADYLEEMVSERNARIEKPGSSERPISTTWLWDLKRPLRLIAKAPIESQMKSLAEEELAGVFLSLHDPQKSALVALNELYKDYGLRLDVIADAVRDQRVLTEEEINLLTEKLRSEKAASAKSRSNWRGLGNGEYETEFGLRKLAMDDETGDIIFEFNKDMMSEILGYDPDEPHPLSKEEFVIRESRIEQRAIEKARSAGRHPNLDLCRMCRDIARPLKPIEDGFQLTAKDIYLPFGNFSQLFCRKHCVICRLIFSAITTDTEELHPQLAAIDQEVQGTRLTTGILSTGEKVIRLLTSQNHSHAMRQSWEGVDHNSLKETIRKREGPIYSRDGQQVNISLIKRWLNDCDHNHGSDMAMVFIDVVDNRLTPATSREKYFALSYVWGRKRQEPQALSTVPFPKTIRDAIQLVKSLGERFLWEQMAKDVPKMNIVYGQAFATIVALHGESADAGLPGTLYVSGKSPDLDHDPQDDKSEAICLVATPRPLSLELNISKWNTRGWIFQERLLSRRCLYFSSDAVYFQCAEKTLSETGVNEEYPSYMLDKVPMKRKITSLRAARDNPLDIMNSLQDMTSKERTSKAFGIYKELVRSYSRREFSFKSDYFQSETYGGLPAGRIPRRGMRLPTPSDIWSWAGEIEGNVQLPTPLFKVYHMGKGSPPQAIAVDENSTSWKGAETAGGKALSPKTSIGRGDHKGTDPSTSPATGQPIEPQNLTVAKLVPDPSRGSTWIIGPPQPQEPWDPPLDANILSFSAPAVSCSAFVISPEKEYLVDQPHIHNQGKQAIRRIYDHQGNHCGLWWEQAGYGYVGLGMNAEAEGRIRMVGISTYGDVYHRREGPSRVEGEIRLFDGESFPETGRGSGLVNVLVVEELKGIGYRCTVAVVHVKAWNAARPKKEHLQLA